jgi:hypothetical protein
VENRPSHTPIQRIKEAALIIEYTRARRHLDVFALIVAGALLTLLLAADWHLSPMPENLKAFIMTMSVASLGFSGSWFVNSMVFLPIRIHLLRRQRRTSR